MAEILISILVAIVFSGVLLTAFPSINTMLRGIISSSSVGVIPIVGAEMVLLPYILVAIGFYVVILIVKHRLQG